MIKRILKGMRKESKENKEIEKVSEEGRKPLSLINPGENAKISHLETKDLKVLQKLMAMGVMPGMPVTLIKKSPTYVFELDQTRYAVDRDIAANIYVSC